MHPAGYTLIELLVVIAIISILAGVSFVNFKGFSTDQATVGAQGQIQTLLRLAQSNAGSSTICSSPGGNSWSVIFRTNNTIDLACGPSNSVKKTYTLTGAEISSILGSGCSASPASLPFIVTYSFGTNNPTFSSAGSNATCLGSDSWTITVVNTKDTSKTRRFKLSKGGAIDVQQ